MLGWICGFSGRGAAPAALISALLVMVAGGADASSGLDIMKEQRDRQEVRSEIALSTMTLVNAEGRERQRRMVTFMRKTEDGRARSLLKYLSPDDIANVGLLTWEAEGDAEADQWLFLPAAGGDVKRIVGSSKKNAFMGSDVAYEDLRSEDLDAHAYTVVREETVDGRPCWVIEARPATERERQDSGYGRRLLWIRQDVYVTVRVDFFDQRDRPLKRADFSDFVNVRERVWRANRARVETERSKTATVTVNERREVDADIPDEMFAPQNIGRRPRYR